MRYTKGPRLQLQLVLSLMVLTVFASCSSGPKERDEEFTRASLLREDIEGAREDGNEIELVNRVQFGYERGILSSEESRSHLSGYVDRLRDRYETARAEGDFPEALRLAWNLSILPGASMNGIESRDQLLLEWAEYLVEEDEPVLALYRLLRRSNLGDLSSEQITRYLGIAGTLNHDEAFHRLHIVANRKGVPVPEPTTDLADPRDEPAEMLRGTVTVWVNKGIRIEEGLGFPDRVIGSGFFVDPRGYLLTNYHVIASEVDPTYEGFSRLYIKLPGRQDQRIPARVVGYDRIFDLALLKVELDPEYLFSLSDTRTLEPGDRVFALGSPGGLDSTITSGIVSASGRRFLQIGDAMQVDVPINPGNSGGPLILPTGQVAGVVFAGLEQFEGVNFAIPAYWIRHFFPRLYDEGEVRHPWLGVSVRERSPGLEVVYVAPASPAEQAGVEVGDLLTGINGVPVSKIGAAQDILLGIEPGYIVHTDWQRDTSQKPTGIERFIAIDTRPYSPVEDALERQSIEQLFPVLFGMNVDEVSAAPWGPDYVITEVFPGSIADESNLSPDDPFAMRNWHVDRDLRVAFIQIIIKKKKAGFIESGIQLGAYLESDSFL
ncbi:MAG: trypsin-like peptidase domain-containing protein [Alkalispirochaeta sp.]